MPRYFLSGIFFPEYSRRFATKTARTEGVGFRGHVGNDMGKIENSRKHRKTRDFLRGRPLRWGHMSTQPAPIPSRLELWIGRMLGYVGPFLGAMLGQLIFGILWGHEGDVRGCVGPSFGATLAHLQPKLTYVGSLLNVILAHVHPF